MVLIYAFWLIGRAIVQNIHQNQTLADATKAVDAAKAKNDALRLEIAYEQTDTYREKELRRRFGYRKAGEVVVSMPENADPETTPTPTAQLEPPPGVERSPARLWWQYFLGKSSQR